MKWWIKSCEITSDVLLLLMFLSNFWRCCKLKCNIFYTDLYFIYPTFFVMKKNNSICHVFLYWHACPQLRNLGLKENPEFPTRKYNVDSTHKYDLSDLTWTHLIDDIIADVTEHSSGFQRVPRWRDQSHCSAVVCVSVIHQMDSGPFQINTFYFHKTIIIHQLKWACLVLGEAGGICRLLWMIWKYERFWRTTLQYHLFRYFWVASRFYLLYITQDLIFPLGATFVPWNWLIAEINLYRREDPRLWDYS